MAGNVLVAERPVTKAGALVPREAILRLKKPPPPYVGRGGRKLAGALLDLKVDPAGAVCLDVGASTGGFTDCLLKNGAARVYAVDVGYGQLDYGLRRDGRVILIERTNIRRLPPDAVPEPIDLATADVSFISLRLVLPHVTPLLDKGGRILALVKPQFEAGREKVGKGGIVKDDEVRRECVEAVREAGRSLGLRFAGEAPSRLPGTTGNREIFVLFEC